VLENKFNKIVSVEDAMKHITDGITLMISGFGGVGASYRLCKEIEEKDVKDLTIISIDAGDPNLGPDHIISSDGKCTKLITSHIGATRGAMTRYLEGELEVEFVSQGILAERIRVGGMGIAGFLSDIGIDTLYADGKPTVEIDGKTYLIEKALHADVAIIFAQKADEYGNLVYSKTACGLNPHMARAADFTIVDTKEIVPFGDIDPQTIITPGAYVDNIVKGGGDWKWAWE